MAIYTLTASWWWWWISNYYSYEGMKQRKKNKNKSVTKDDIYRQSSFEKKEQVILNNKLYRIYEICVSYQYFIFIDSISQVCVCVHVCLSWCGDIKNGLCHDLFSLLSNILQKKKFINKIFVLWNKNDMCAMIIIFILLIIIIITITIFIIII